MSTRRDFLSGLSVAAMLEYGPALAGAADGAANPAVGPDTTRVPFPEGERWPAASARTRFVVINDIHATAEETRGLDQIIAGLNVEKPVFMVLVGDLNKGQLPPADEHEAAMKALMRIMEKAEFPCWYGMGNTDMATGDDPFVVFNKWTGAEPYYRFEHGGVYFFMLYTEKPQPARFGIVHPKQMAWLTEQLRDVPPEAPVVLFGHHALFDAVGKWEKDNWGIENSQELLKLLAWHRLVATFSGHRHLNRMARDHRGVLHVINGTMYADHSDEIGPKQDGTGYRWVEIDAEGIQTSWVRVGESPVRSE